MTEYTAAVLGGVVAVACSCGLSILINWLLLRRLDRLWNGDENKEAKRRQELLEHISGQCRRGSLPFRYLVADGQKES